MACPRQTAEPLHLQFDPTHHHCRHRSRHRSHRSHCSRRRCPTTATTTTPPTPPPPPPTETMQFIRGPLQFVHRTLERIAVLPLGRQRLSKHALEEALPRVLDPMNPNVRDPNRQRLVLINLRRTLARLFRVRGYVHTSSFNRCCAFSYWARTRSWTAFSRSEMTAGSTADLSRSRTFSNQSLMMMVMMMKAIVIVIKTVCSMG